MNHKGARVAPFYLENTMAKKIILYPESYRREVQASAGSDADKEAIEKHFEGYLGFVRKEMHRDGWTVEEKKGKAPSIEGTDAEGLFGFDDADDPDDKLEGSDLMAAMPDFWTWYDNPERVEAKGEAQ